MKTFQRANAGLALCALAFASVGAQAQEVNLFQNLMIDYTRINLNNQLLERAYPTGPSAASAAALVFTPSREVRKANLARIAAKARPQSPELAAEIDALIASGDVIESMAATLAPMGLETNNLADANTVYLMSAWLASRERSDTPSIASVNAVKGQITRALLASPEVVAAPDEGKQEYAEVMLLQAALIESAMQQAEGRADDLRAVAEAARAGARALGINLGSLELTDEGFRPQR